MKTYTANEIAKIIKGHFTREEYAQKVSLMGSFVAQLSDYDRSFDAKTFISKCLREGEVGVAVEDLI